MTAPINKVGNETLAAAAIERSLSFTVPSAVRGGDNFAGSSSNPLAGAVLRSRRARLVQSARATAATGAAAPSSAQLRPPKAIMLTPIAAWANATN